MLGANKIVAVCSTTAFHAHQHVVQKPTVVCTRGGFLANRLALLSSFAVCFFAGGACAVY